MTTVLMFTTLTGALWFPLVILVRRRDFAFLPGIVYAFAVWVYLVAGIPFMENPLGGEQWVIRYGIVLAIAVLPIWVLLLLPASPASMHHTQVSRYIGDVLSFFVLWIICFTGVAVYLVQFGATPFLSVLTESGISSLGRASLLVDIRQEATYTEQFGRIRIFYYIMPPLIALYGHVLYRQGRIGLLLNTLSIVIAMLLTVQYLHKGTLVFFVAKLFLLDMCMTRVSAGRLAALCVTTFAMIIGMYVFYAGNFDTSLLMLITQRIAVVYIEIMEFALATWPVGQEFYWGITFPNPGGILPYTAVNVAGEIFELLRGGLGNAPIPSFGEGYVNFGYLGVFIVTAFIGTWLALLIMAFPYVKRDALLLAIWVALAFDVNAFGRTSFFGAVSTMTLVIITLMVTLAFLIRIYLNTIIKNKDMVHAAG